MTLAGSNRPGLDLEDLLLLSTIVLLPWAFGGVDLWAYRTASFLLVGAATIALAREGWAGLGLDRSRRWLIPAALLALWAGVQILPLPPSWIEIASPRADALYRESFPGYPGNPAGGVASAVEAEALRRVPEAEGVPLPPLDDGFTAEYAGRWTGWRTLSLHPAATAERLAWFTALLIGFLAVSRRLDNRGRLRTYRSVLFVNLLVLAGVALVCAATANGKLLWVRETLSPGRSFGPYVNPTNFAGMMEMIVPWLLGSLLLRYRREGRSALARGLNPLWAAAVVLGLTAGLATASKSAAAILFVEVLLLFLLAARRWRTRLAVLGGMLLTGALSLPLLGQTTLGVRVQQFIEMTGGDYGEVNRLVAWRSGWRMVLDFPWTGVGFGAFRDAFPRYLQPGEFARWAQVHNDYLELLIDGGLVAALLVLVLTVQFWRRIVSPRALRAADGLDLEQVGLGLGLAALSVHAVFDFNHQIPGNALMFVTLAAVALASARARSRSGP